MKKLIYLILLLGLLASNAYAGDNTTILQDIVQWKNITIQIPIDFEQQQNNDKLFFAKKLNGINNLVAISTIGNLDISNFIVGLRNDNKKLALISTSEGIIGDKTSTIVIYKIVDDTTKRIMISNFVSSENIRIVFYGAENEYPRFNNIIQTLRFSE